MVGGGLQVQYSGACAGCIAICCVNTSTPQRASGQHSHVTLYVITTAPTAPPTCFDHRCRCSTSYKLLSFSTPPPFSLRYVIRIILLIVRVVCFVYNVQNSDQSIYSILFYALPNNRDKMRAKAPNHYPYILVKT